MISSSPCVSCRTAVQVRYEHDRDAPGGYDVTEDGLHRDIHHNSDKYRTEEVLPSIPANEAFDRAEEE